MTKTLLLLAAALSLSALTSTSTLALTSQEQAMCESNFARCKAGVASRGGGPDFISKQCGWKVRKCSATGQWPSYN